MYYADKIETLRDIFGQKDVHLEDDHIAVNGVSYPIVDDVIILLDPSQYPPLVKTRSNDPKSKYASRTHDFAEEIQYTFGKEWERYPRILPEHRREFLQYFDLVDVSELRNLRVCDLGCGNGRWSYFLGDVCRELVLVDFSEAILVARKNLSHVNNAIFFMANLRNLPFRNDFTDFLFCLGVLHHLPTPSLDEVRILKRYAPRLLIYLYYTLDNRPFYFRPLFGVADVLRRRVSKSRAPFFRDVFTWFAAMFFYRPFVFLGKLSQQLGLRFKVPLYETYQGKSLERIRQDVYDRFFTTIEQRHSRKQIMELNDTFSSVFISDQLPYWHFLCER